jgi:hypothetical protein
LYIEWYTPINIRVVHTQCKKKIIILQKGLMNEKVLPGKTFDSKILCSKGLRPTEPKLINRFPSG